MEKSHSRIEGCLGRTWPVRPTENEFKRAGCPLHLLHNKTHPLAVSVPSPRDSKLVAMSSSRRRSPFVRLRQHTPMIGWYFDPNDESSWCVSGR